MSATLDQIDQAVRTHLSTHRPGQLVVGWALVIASTTNDGEATRYDTTMPDGQPAHHTLGLYRLGQAIVESRLED